MSLSVRHRVLARHSLRICSKDTRLASCESGSLISKKCVERSTYGQARTMWGQQEASRLRRLHVISRSARASKAKRAHGSLSSHPLKRGGTSRSYVKKG